MNAARNGARRDMDHVPVLHNCGPTTHAVYRTGSVGAETMIEPRNVVCGLLALAGVSALSASMLRPVAGVQLHPALIAAAAGITLDLASTALHMQTTVDDRELHALLVQGRGALHATRVHYSELATERLSQLREYTARVCGKTRLNGVVRWQEQEPVATATPMSVAADAHAAAQAALFSMSLLAYAAPPIVSFRRAPSLTYFRVHGRLQVRDFTAPEAA